MSESTPEGVQPAGVFAFGRERNPIPPFVILNLPTNMHFWRKKYFQTLKEAATEASESPDWADYAAFCAEYERGLRPQAFKSLERFIGTIERAPFEARRRFVSWLLHRADGREGQHMLVPFPLRLRVVEPTLLEWTEVEPGCSEPHRWLGGYEHLKRALELAREDELARRKLVVLILGKVGMSTHELPIGYLGVVHEDLEALSEAEGLLKNLSNNDYRIQFAASIGEERALIEE